jgi:hypothetical protein
MRNIGIDRRTLINSRLFKLGFRYYRKPIEFLEDMIGKLGGFAGQCIHVNAGKICHGGNFSDGLVNSALRYRAQAPLIDQMLKEIGITPGDISKIAESVVDQENSE